MILARKDRKPGYLWPPKEASSTAGTMLPCWVRHGKNEFMTHFMDLFPSLVMAFQLSSDTFVPSWKNRCFNKKNSPLSREFYEKPILSNTMTLFGSMFGIFIEMYHKSWPNVGKYTIHDPSCMDPMGFLAFLSRFQGFEAKPRFEWVFRSSCNVVFHNLGSYSIHLNKRLLRSSWSWWVGQVLDEVLGLKFRSLQEYHNIHIQCCYSFICLGLFRIFFGTCGNLVCFQGK